MIAREMCSLFSSFSSPKKICIYPSPFSLPPTISSSASFSQFLVPLSQNMFESLHQMVHILPVMVLGTLLLLFIIQIRNRLTWCQKPFTKNIAHEKTLLWNYKNNVNRGALNALVVLTSKVFVIHVKTYIRKEYLVVVAPNLDVMLMSLWHAIKTCETLRILLLTNPWC